MKQFCEHIQYNENKKNGGQQEYQQQGSDSMKNSAVAGHRVHRKHALTTTGRSHRHAKRVKIYGNVRKTASESTAIVQMQPNLRITPVMQAEILRLYVGGHSLCEIARRTHRARQTVTKVVRAPDIQAKVQELRERLLGESDDWLESINFAVTHETDARLAYKLSEVFGIIPSPSKKAAPVKPPDDWAGIDPETLARAKVSEWWRWSAPLCHRPKPTSVKHRCKRPRCSLSESVGYSITETDSFGIPQRTEYERFSLLVWPFPRLGQSKSCYGFLDQAQWPSTERAESFPSGIRVAINPEYETSTRLVDALFFASRFSG